MPDGGLMEAAALAADLKRAADDVKKIAETTNAELRNLGTVTSETKGIADQALAKHTELAQKNTEISQRIDAMEQQLARRGGPAGEPQRRKSLGEMVVEDEGVKALMQSGRGKASIDVKTIVSALTTDADGSAGDLIEPDRRPGILQPLVPRFFVRDLLTPGRTTSTSIQYIVESGYTNNAATVAENTGALKPSSDIKFDIKNVGITTIAHWMLATKQILSDVPMLQSYIEGRMRWGLAAEEESQLLMGAGTGTDLTGIYTVATAYSAGITVPNATPIDELRIAILQTALSEIEATGIVISAQAWASIELSKTDDGAYLFSNPTGVAGARLWGLPVVPTKALGPTNKFLVGAFRLGAQIFDRWDATVLLSTEDSDNFRRNLVTILAEERLGLAIYRPEAFIKGTFTATI
jgi:HK97 family phage major capsid protein